MKQRRTRARVWLTPMALGVVTVVGLIAALLSDEAGDVLAWVALATPVSVVIWCARPRNSGHDASD
ncbi:MAG: hypothetical protein ACREV5_03060 [Steroidobacter sp.]